MKAIYQAPQTSSIVVTTMTNILDISGEGPGMGSGGGSGKVG